MVDIGSLILYYYEDMSFLVLYKIIVLKENICLLNRKEQYVHNRIE